MNAGRFESARKTIVVPSSALLAAVRSRDCVPFLGAGISRPSGMPGWAEIVAAARESVSEQLGYLVGPDELDFLQVPQVQESLAGSNQSLRKLLDEAFLGFEPSPYHVALAQMPVDTYVTTNWDGLLERSLDEASFRAPVQVLYRDDQVANWSESQHTNVIKMHGTITDHSSIVFSEQQYLDRYGADSLLFQLVRVLLASRSVLMVGFGYTDPFVKLLFRQVARLVAGSHKPHWFITSEDRVTPAFRYYLRQVGFNTVILPSSASQPAGISDFLQHLARETRTVVHDRSSRARLLHRVIEPLDTYLGPERIIRIRATLGPFGSPEPDPAEPVFESAARDEEEYRLHRACIRLVEDKQFRVHLIGRPAALDALLVRGYSRTQALRRIRAFADTARRLGPRFEFAPMRSASDRNQWIAANRSVVESWKEVSGSHQLYSRAMLHEERGAVTLAARLFDEDFKEAQDRGGGPDQTRKQLFDDLDAVLREG